MQIRKTVVPFVCCSLILTAGTLGHEQADTEEASFSESYGIIELDGTDAVVGAYRRNGHVVRLYGQAFSTGASPAASAQAFIDANAGRLGLAGADVVPSAQPTQPLVWNPDTETYKFTAVYFAQERDGLPVYGSRLTLLVRNETDHPLVLASADLRDLGDFAPPADPAVPDLDEATRERLSKEWSRCFSEWDYPSR